jgi:hypothetical protein
MSTPTNGCPFKVRVVIETQESDGSFRRVHVWRDSDLFVAFNPGLTEKEAESVVRRGLGILKPLNIPVLFQEAKKRKRWIETD